jgi:glucose uptake protein
MAAAAKKTSVKGIVLSVVAGVLMGGFYSFVAQSMGAQSGRLSPYTAIVLFSAGVLVSNLLWNSVAMARPFNGPPVSYRDYVRKGTPRLHLIGIMGGMIWNLGMSFSIIASTAAGPALSYGLGQGATMVGALWGVFIWKEFKGAPAGTGYLLTAMFALYVLGLGVLIGSR